VFNTPLYRPSSVQGPSRPGRDGEYITLVSGASSGRIAPNVHGVADASLSLTPGPHMAIAQHSIQPGMCDGVLQENVTYHSFGDIQRRFNCADYPSASPLADCGSR